jgi:hypothetical protein
VRQWLCTTKRALFLLKAAAAHRRRFASLSTNTKWSSALSSSTTRRMATSVPETYDGRYRVGGVVQEGVHNMRRVGGFGGVLSSGFREHGFWVLKTRDENLTFEGMIPAHAVLRVGNHPLKDLQALFSVFRRGAERHERNFGRIPRMPDNTVIVALLKSVERFHQHHRCLQHPIQPSILSVEPWQHTNG